MAEPRWLDEREAHVWQAYLDLQRELLGAVERQLAGSSGLSGADYSVLVPLSEAPDGALRPRELCASTGWDRSRLSHQLRRMEKRGLLTREECATDARGSVARLTDAGRVAIVAAAPEHVETVRRYFFDLVTPEEQDALVAVFDRILTNLDADTT
jgi:DNA-binding MarR family transcriptional regulator